MGANEDLRKREQQKRSEERDDWKSLKMKKGSADGSTKYCLYSVYRIIH